MKVARINWKKARAAQEGLKRLAKSKPHLLAKSGPTNVAGWEDVLREIEMPKSKTMMVAFRLPEEMVKRLDAHAGRIATTTGITVTRADVVKLLLSRGLEVVERESVSGKKPVRRT